MQKKIVGTFRYIPKEIKEQVLKRIKEDGVSASQAALEHGIARRTIYTWLKGNTTSDGSILEISRLKRENKELLEIIGRLTHDLTKSKKN